MRLIAIFLLCLPIFCLSQNLINCGSDTMKFNLLNASIHQYMIENVARYRATKWSEMMINPITSDIGIPVKNRVLKSLSNDSKKEIVKHTLDWQYSDNEYLSGKYLITNSVYGYKLEVSNIIAVEIKGLLSMIPYEIYLDNKKLIESRIDLYKCVIRRVRKNELIEAEN